VDETVEILADSDLMQVLRDSQVDVETGRLVPAAEVLAAVSSWYSGVRRVVVLTASVRRQLDRLPRSAAIAVLEFATGPLCHEPYKLGALLALDLTGYCVARFDGYCVVYAVDSEMITIYGVADLMHPLSRSQ
jgi:mRNA-degrading endonuclease RelE of RelBE toxin-antitoxin system